MNLIFLALFGAFLASIAAAFLWLIAQVFQSPNSDIQSARRRAALLYPFFFVIYCGVAFIPIMFWREWRGLDPGVGDAWTAPIGNDYFVTAIDTLDTLAIHKKHHGASVVFGITELNRHENLSYGSSIGSGLFVFDTTYGVITHSNLTRDAFDQYLAQHNLSPRLLPADDFYFQNANDWADHLAFFVILIPPILFLRRQWKLKLSSKAVARDATQV